MNRGFIALVALITTVGALCCDASVALAQDVVWVGDERFQSIEGNWFQLDDQDEQWKLIPGVIVVRFDGSVNSGNVGSALSGLSLTVLSPRADIGGYYRFSYDENASPPEILYAR